MALEAEEVEMTLVEVEMASVEVEEVEGVVMALAEAEDMDVAEAIHLVTVPLEEVDMTNPTMGIHFRRSTS